MAFNILIALASLFLTKALTWLRRRLA